MKQLVLLVALVSLAVAQNKPGNEGGLPTGVANGSVGASNAVSQPGGHQIKPVIDVTEQGFIGNGVRDNTAAATTLLGTIGSNSATVLFAAGTFLLGTISFPANVTLEFSAGGAISVATGQTVTIQGPINATPRQIFFNVASGQGSLSFSGNRSMATYSPVWFGIDCTGVTDAAPIWNRIASFTGEDTAFVVPNNCSEKIGSTINVSSRAGFKLLSMDRVQNGGGNQRPAFQWTGSSGGMWNFIANQAATVEGFSFTNTTNLDYYLSFDQDPSTRINTEGMARYNTFTSSTNNANFSAIRIGYMSGQNGEKNVITDNDFFCSQTSALHESDNGVLTSSSQRLTCSDCAFTTDATIGERIRVSYATGIVDTTVHSITNNTTLVMAASATSNQTGARIHLGGALGNGIIVGNVNAKHNTFDRDSFTQCACGVNMRTGSFSGTHWGGSANDVLLCVNDISEPSEADYLEDENSLRAVQTTAPLDAPLTLNHLRNSLSNGSEFDGNIYFGNGATASILNSTVQLSLPANSVLIRKAPNVTVNLVSMGNTWGRTMASLGFSQWRSELEASPSNVVAFLMSCGDQGITDAPGTCFQFGDGGELIAEGHLVASGPRNTNTSSFQAYTAELPNIGASFVNEAVGYKANFGNASASFLNLSTSANLIGYDVTFPSQLRGGNSLGYRFHMPIVQPGTTVQPFSVGFEVEPPSGNTDITTGIAFHAKSLCSVTGIGTCYSFKADGASDIASFAGRIESTLASGTAPFSVTSTTPVANLTVSNHPTLVDCGTTSTCSAARKTAALIVRGSVAFPTATTVTLTSLPFTSSSSYSCTAGDQTNPAGVVNATTYTSGSSVTFTETNGVNTDTIRYICVGF